MRKFKRLPCPDCLKNNSEKWGNDWERRRKEDASAQFHWHQINNKPVNQLLLPALKQQTQEHCSFCDQFPVEPPSVGTIEHFYPKSEYPLKAYQWENLYFCCCHCQQKQARFDDKLLRPDADDYSFDRYFDWDYTQGLIKENSQASPADQERAKCTIELYQLNVGHPRCRRLELQKRRKALELPIDDFAYRDFLKV
jgi:uncharacterized protein (TIGR02646 family)